MKKIRYGIVGCGSIHKTHADGIRGVDSAELTGFYDTDFERSAKAAEAYGVTKANSLEELFGMVDAVTICLPSGLHADVTILAARAGKHVLTEKPLEITLAKATMMVEECERAGVKLGCISQHRFAKDMQRLKAAVDAGELGKLIQGDSFTKWFRSPSYYESAGWRGTWAMDGGGALMNQGVHYVDMIQWIMGGVKSVQARTSTMIHTIEVEDTALAIVEYNNGAIGIIQGSTSLYPGLGERLEIHGTKGTVVIESDRAKIWVTKEPAEQEPFGATMQMMKDHNLPEDASTKSWSEAHRLQIEDFSGAILEDREPAISGRAALEPLKVILAIYESSKRDGAKVDLAELGSLA